MKAFLSIKFWSDNRNRAHIEAILNTIEGLGIEVFCFVRDAEEWGKKRFQPEEMMRLTFDKIDHSDLVIADVADWPIGVGVEAGYAYAKGIPILCICPVAKSVASTVAGLVKHVIRYKSYDDLAKKLVPIKDLIKR